MFKIHRQTPGEGAVKKSIQKLFDPKKDVVTRLKHLRNVIDNSNEFEVQNLFETHYSHIYFIFYENFLLAESNLRQKGSHRAQREELDAILLIFEQILINLPELLHQRWQYHSIDNIIKRLLHSQNSLKVRREGLHFFLLWLRALQENALPRTLLLYACLIPGFPPPTFSDGKPYSLEWLVNIPINEEYGIHQVEIMCLVPPSSGEKIPNDLTKYFLDALLEFMVLESRILRWKNETEMATKSFSFLWDLFKESYLPHAFPDFNASTSIYNCNLDLPEPRDSVNYVLNVSDSGSIDPRIEVASGCSMLSARVSIIKWIVAFTGTVERTFTTLRPDSKVEALQRKVLEQLQELNLSNNDKSSETSDGKSSQAIGSSNLAQPQHQHQLDTDASNSNTSTLTEREPSISSLSSLDDKLRSSASSEDFVRGVLYSNRSNINIVHELFRQAFILPLTEVPTMRRVVKVYQEWIQEDNLPVFMEQESDNDDNDVLPAQEPPDNSNSLHQPSTNSLQNISYMRGQLHSLINEGLSTHIRAGTQGTLQLFITNSAHVFLVEPPGSALKLIEAQVDVCKRVLNLYRHMVMNVFLSEVTWHQLLKVLLHITRVMLQEVEEEDPAALKQATVADKLAGPVFQTLIVSWIKANLFVHVSSELWDELLEVLSSLHHWVELVEEWSKNMETMTRVLSRHVYRLELQDLPLDRLTEQKHKRQKKIDPGLATLKENHTPPIITERSFSRGWSRDSMPLKPDNLDEDTGSRQRSRSAYLPRKFTIHPPQTGHGEKEKLKTNQTKHSKAPNLEPPRKRSCTSLSPGSVGVSPRKASSESTIKSTLSAENNGTLKRYNSASDISGIVKSASSTSPSRHRSDSEGQNTSDRNHPNISIYVVDSEHRVVLDSTDVTNISPNESVDVIQGVTVKSGEADDMFDELIHERLYGDPSNKELQTLNKLDEVTSAHSIDSVSLDADWNQIKEIDDEDKTPSVEKISMEFAMFGNAVGSSQRSHTIESEEVEVNRPSQGIPLSPQRLDTEDIATNHIDTFSYNLPQLPPLSQTPPAIPARKALPLPVSLDVRSFLTPAMETADFAIPSNNNSDTSDYSPCYDPMRTLITANMMPLSPNLPSPTQSPPLLPFTHLTNITESNTEPHDHPKSKSALVDNGAKNGVTNLSLKVNQNRIHERDDLYPVEEVKHPFSLSEKSNKSDADDDTDDTEDDKLTNSDDVVEEDVVSLQPSETVLKIPRIVAKDEDDEVILSTSTADILLQPCSASHTGKSSHDHHALFDEVAHDHHSNQDEAENRSIMAGGTRTGWYPDVAVALWRRLLGILGDVNEIRDSRIHKLVFYHLNILWDVLFKMRQNIGIVPDNNAAPDCQELVPPLRMLAPWAFKATMNLPATYKGGKLHAYQLLCKMTVQREHDIPLEPDHLAQFYSVLHESLHSSDQDVVNEIVGNCSQYFSTSFPSSTMLLLDFLYACHAMASSQHQKAPRVEAQTILGSTLCFPNLYHNIPVLKPDSNVPSAMICSNIKDYVVEALLTSCKKEPSAAARCIALSSTGLWLYEEVTSQHHKHSRVKEAINVLLVSLKFGNRTVASVASSQLHLLTHCSNEIMREMPDMPPRIIEVISLTVSSLVNNPEVKDSEPGRQLLVSLLLCILDWCMAVPLELLTETIGAQSDKRLIRTVFKALQTAALGKPGHSAKHSYSLSDLASQDFDPNLQLDKVNETPSSVIVSRNKSVMSRSLKLGKDGAVSLAAHTVLNHLTNHLGHFPLARGTSVLTSRVSEHHDVMDDCDELSSELFASPDVQLFIFNDSCLLSVVEITAEDDKPGGGPSAGMKTSNRCVRFIVRDAGGKYCWDSSVLYGAPDVTEVTLPVHCEPLSTLDAEIGKVARESCKSYVDYALIENDKQHKVTFTPLPHHEVELSDGCPDRLDQLLQYMSWSSPECQALSGKPLNIPSLPPECMFDDLQDDVIRSMLHHHKSLGGNYQKNSLNTGWKCCPTKPSQIVTSHSSFYHARLLCTEMGFLSRENRHRVNLLTKNERLLRELKNLDSRLCRETHKVAVLYISEGQEDKLSVLSNTGGSKEYEDFVAGLGWEVELSTHSGFRGKLQNDGSTGRTAPYYATSTLEVVYHVATRFPSGDDDARNVKLKHLGNDEVHIVWSEHHRDYRRGIIPTEFGDVLIVIYPIRHGLYRVQIIKKPDIPYFGPLFDGAVVNARVLPVLVRETAINAGRAKRSQISLYQPFYEERTRYLRQIIEQFKEEKTFEDYCAHLFSPAPQGIKQHKESITSDVGELPRAPLPSGGVVADHQNMNNNNRTSSDVLCSHQLAREAGRRHRQPSGHGSQDIYEQSDHVSLHEPLKPSLPSMTTTMTGQNIRSTPAGVSSEGPSPFIFPAPTMSSLTSNKSQRHVSFKPNLSDRTAIRGFQLQTSSPRNCPDIMEFPFPPQAPPTYTDISND